VPGSSFDRYAREQRTRARIAVNAVDAARGVLPGQPQGYPRVATSCDKHKENLRSRVLIAATVVLFAENVSRSSGQQICAPSGSWQSRLPG
jgi:hypothetical protein